MTEEKLDPKDYCKGQVPAVGNGYEYDCEPREYSDVAKAQWKQGRPPEFDVIPDYKPVVKKK